MKVNQDNKRGGSTDMQLAAGEESNITELLPRQEQALLALAMYPSVAAAAQAIGVGETTLYRWMQQPEFKQAQLAFRRQMMAQAVDRLQMATAVAVKTLTAVCEDAEAPPATRIAASKAILEMALRAAEQVELNTRMDDLEDLLMVPQLNRDRLADNARDEEDGEN